VLVLLDGQPLVGARGVKRGGVLNLDRQSTARLERVPVHHRHRRRAVVRDPRRSAQQRGEKHADSYEWEFVPIPGAAFRDFGLGRCH